MLLSLVPVPGRADGRGLDRAEVSTSHGKLHRGSGPGHRRARRSCVDLTNVGWLTASWDETMPLFAGGDMEAHARDLEKIFDKAIQYQIPLFQRPYVWTEDKGWEELWEDIEGLLNKEIVKGKVHPHFMGAVVLEQLGNATGAVEVRQIIDGQQRFTTLQIVMTVCRDQALALDSEKYGDRFGDLVGNRANRIDKEDEAFKVWPTNSDRPAYRLIQACGSVAELEKQLKFQPILRSSNIVGAYGYFSKRLTKWFDSEIEGEDGLLVDQPDVATRLEALWTVMRGKLQLVVIDLHQQDEAQVIFETMNSLGEPLLPSDLIKNYLFRLAMAEDADVEKLYGQHWAFFDEKPWRIEVKQGRITRPLVDIFLNHYLALVTQDDVKSTHLFNAFKGYVQDEDKKENKLIGAASTAAEHMAMLARFGRIYRGWSDTSAHPRLATFLRRLDAVDTTTVFPFLLMAHDHLMPENPDEFDKVLTVVESFLVRRMVCQLTTKNYNKLFIDLIKGVAKSGVLTADSVGAWLARSKAESLKFPTNEDFGTAIAIYPIYKNLSQKKVRAILEALDASLQHKKSEAVPLPSGLTIEHVMPQEWEENWPMPDKVGTDPSTVKQWKDRREVVLQTLGNLTLITGSLNPSLSNGPWSEKRPELLKFSKLNLTQYFHDDAKAATWDEDAIIKRGIDLVGKMLDLWPDVKRASETQPEVA